MFFVTIDNIYSFFFGNFIPNHLYLVITATSINIKLYLFICSSYACNDIINGLLDVN